MTENEGRVVAACVCGHTTDGAAAFEEHALFGLKHACRGADARGSSAAAIPEHA